MLPVKNWLFPCLNCKLNSSEGKTFISDIRGTTSKIFCSPSAKLDYVVKVMDEVKRGCKPALYRNRAYQLTDAELSTGYETYGFTESQGNLQLGVM